jgi:6-phosphofructokinase 1
MPQPPDFLVARLGVGRFPSPLRTTGSAASLRFTTDDQRIPYDVDLRDGWTFRPEVSFERAGPREQIYFDPAETTAAIITCGGLCPGLNNVIRSVVMQLWHGYGVRRIFGVRHGYRGLHPNPAQPLLPLDPKAVSDIHKQGGTLLGSSRGPGDLAKMLETIIARKINILFTLGGDGTQRGAKALADYASSRGYELAVVGIPKTIDNDIPFVFRTFGYATAVESAMNVIDSAHNEARGALRGIGLVKLMGRDAGYIAAGATLTSQVVNFCLIPEAPFQLEGPGGLLEAIEQRLARKSHAVIVVAEGAGQHLMPESAEVDASGNRRFGDIGLFLASKIREYFTSIGQPVELKYLDPSYYIRSAPANATDAALCDQFARAAVHAAMAGKTNVIIGLWHGVLTHVPISMASNRKKQITEDGELWQSVLKTTGQPPRMGARSTEESPAADSSPPAARPPDRIPS